MKNSRFIVSLLFSLFAISLVFGQDKTILDGIYKKEHTPNKKPIPYAYVREADVYWSKKVWRIIDLREKINMPMYYPSKAMDGRKSLIDVLIDAIKYEGLQAYSDNDDEFKQAINIDQVSQAMGAINDTTDVQDPSTGLWSKKVVLGDIKYHEVKQVLVKEIWFFDRNYSKLDVRIIGICPIRDMVKTTGGVDEIVKKQVFWVYFPAARDVLSRYEVFNPKGDSQRLSYDDIFMKRYFSSYITAESNVYDNRPIEMYSVGMQSMVESDRIKNDIATFEHDLWEF
ncbi:MAG: gliding motility protein GldN [Breznakibacter sp.]|nr:gliding motility protein GldN [Breznakibacter sp.]